MKNTLKWLYVVPEKKKGYIAVLTLIQVVSGCTGVLYALLMRNVVDSAVGRDIASFWKNAIYLLVLSVALIGMNAVTRWLSELARADIENLLKKRLTECIMKKDYASVSSVFSGEWMTRLTGDTTVVAGGYVELIPGFVGTMVRLFSALIMIIILDRWFAYILIPGGVAMVFLTYVFRKELKRLHKKIQESDGRLRTYLQERIGSLMVIKAFSAQDQTVDDAWEKMQEHKAARMKRNVFSIICNIGFTGAMQGMYLISMVYCAYGILTGTVTYGTLTAILQLVSQIQGPFANLSGFVSRFYSMTASAERLMEIESFQEDCPEGILEREKVQAYYQEKFLGISLRNLDFSYPASAREEGLAKRSNEAIVLKGLSLEIRKGEYVAFTGYSGCGKTTVLRLLTCIYAPDAGERLLLGADGEQALTAKWRRLFAYVPQGNFLMCGKLRDVVAFSRPEEANNDEKLMQALNIACVNEFLPELEKGLDTQLGERGFGLSEGQMQRVAIARAIFSEAPILLLDESTSALDEGVETRVLENLRKLTDKTVIIITHGKAALACCDREIRFAETKVEEA